MTEYSWKRIREDCFILDAGERTLHAFWDRGSAPYTTYFLALSDKSSIPYNERPLRFASYSVGDINPADRHLLEVRGGQDVGWELLSYKDLVENTPGIPEERKARIISLLNAVEKFFYEPDNKNMGIFRWFGSSI